MQLPTEDRGGFEPWATSENGQRMRQQLGLPLRGCGRGLAWEEPSVKCPKAPRNDAPSNGCSGVIGVIQGAIGLTIGRKRDKSEINF